MGGMGGMGFNGSGVGGSQGGGIEIFGGLSGADILVIR